MASIFDKVVSAVDKGVTAVGANSKAMVEKAKVNSAIAGIENERAKLVGLLGQKVYDMHKAQGEVIMDESMINFVAEIDNRVEKISQMQEQLKRIEGELSQATGGNDTATCANCGHSNSANSKFCVGCGQQL